MTLLLELEESGSKGKHYSYVRYNSQVKKLMTFFYWTNSSNRCAKKYYLLTS